MLTPTYTGCPATEVIEQSVLEAIRSHGVDRVSIERVLSPPWTTDWISDAGREKLREYGIAPPAHAASKRSLLQGERSIACPRCNSIDTTLVSEFGSTACKASYKCRACLEPFEYFKCI
jgi:ring-1,2-phenylacetyl-CoA epoxidase subunit PaaD